MKLPRFLSGSDKILLYPNLLKYTWFRFVFKIVFNQIGFVLVTDLPHDFEKTFDNNDKKVSAVAERKLMRKNIHIHI